MERREMIDKQKILAAVQEMPQNLCIDDIIDRLWLLRKIEIGQAQADRGEGIEHEELMERCLRPGGTE